jgi:hypothetical protein
MKFRDHLKNAVGYTTNRKIVVIESDDWGSIRTRSKKDYDIMLSKGLELDNNSYTMYDALESNTDLKRLYEVLTSVKDSNGKYAVFTPMYIMANPKFEKIKESNFENYYYENFIETCNSYPDHDKVEELIKDGIQNRLFVPALHGREHLNVPRWLRILKSGNEGALLSFQHQSIGANIFKGVNIPMYLAAFDPEFPEDNFEIEKSLIDAAKIFLETFGYQAEHFIESNAYGLKDLESVLSKIGIKYLLRSKITRYSNYNNNVTKPYFHWVGKRNRFGQIYLTRNCTFEPHRPLDSLNVVTSCLNEIEIAFKWKKPAVIISHRASYVGSIDEKNQINGLTKLEQLLKSIIKKWPDVEFMTSMELGNIIKS